VFKESFPESTDQFCQCQTASQLGLVYTWWVYRDACHLRKVLIKYLGISVPKALRERERGLHGPESIPEGRLKVPIMNLKWSYHQRTIYYKEIRFWICGTILNFTNLITPLYVMTSISLSVLCPVYYHFSGHGKFVIIVAQTNWWYYVTPCNQHVWCTL